MAGHLRLLTHSALLALSAAASAQTPVAPPAAATAGPPEAHGKHREGWLRGLRHEGAEGTPSPELDNVRRALEALTPEQRKRFQDNFARWANLPPEEKKALRDREEVRRKFMEDEAASALREMGMPLDGPQREVFVHRYMEERRKIEEKLRQEVAERRKPLLHELLNRLKTEFSGASSGAAGQGTPVSPAPNQPGEGR